MEGQLRKHKSKLKGRRKRGKPRLRCLEEVAKDLGEMKVKRWRQKAMYRDERESVTKEAKALRGS